VKLAASRSQIEVVNDQRGCPTYTFDLADAIIKLCHADAKGILHATNSGVCTWFEFAVETLRQAGSNTLVHPTTSDKFVRPAPRPSYSVLSDASLSAYGIKMRDWRETLPDYLREREAA
jgi:dTDP-4-dehydrorhamnose reductase